MSTPSQREQTLDHLVPGLDRDIRESNRVLVRWLLGNEVPLLPACALSTEDAAEALRELRSLSAMPARTCGSTSPPCAANGC